MIKFNELTQYVIEENGVMVVKDIEQVDTPIEEPPQVEFVEYVEEPTLEERNRSDIDYLAIMTGVDL